MRIAICDDDIKELDRTESILRSYQKQHSGCDFSIERFGDADELLWIVSEGEYMPDLLFIDIYMPGKLGIEAAKELRKMGSECCIVFLTASKEYALEAFSVDAAQYLGKPISDKEIFRILDKFIKEVTEEEKKYLLIRSEGIIRKIALHNIICCEAQKKHQYLNMADGTQLVQSMTMAKIYEMLSGYPEFVRVGVSYIINLEHVVSLNAQEVQMDDGKKIFLPRGTYQGLREQYLEYYCREEE